MGLCAPKQTVKTFPGVKGTRIPRRRQHQGWATRLDWPGRLRNTLEGKSDRAARGDVVLAQAVLGHGRRYTPVADVVLHCWIKRL